MSKGKANSEPVTPSEPKNSPEEVRRRFPCRDEVITNLEKRLTTIKWPFLLISGPHSLGKTDVTRALLEALKIPFSWNNCLEFVNLKSLQNKILYDIHLFNRPNVQFKSHAQSNETFINEMMMSLEGLTTKTSKVQRVSVPKTPTKTPTKSGSKRRKTKVDSTLPIEPPNEPASCRFFIVLDNYEKLIDSNINILHLLNQVHETMKTKVHLITIMITSLCPDQLLYNFALIPSPITFTFPAFDPKTLPTVISRLANDDIDETYYNFSEIVSQTLSSSICDLRKLSFICQTAFMDHIDEIPEGLPEEEIQKQMRKYFLDNVEYYIDLSLSLGGSDQVTTSSFLQELPVSTKYLLIAAFLTSYNSKASDRKLFVVKSDKTKCRPSTKQKETTASAPKLFPLERLLHIYQSLISLNENEYHELEETQLDQPTNQLLSQIETLVNLKLLIKVNSVTISPLSSLIKYQISDFVTYEFIDCLAKSVGISLLGHLSF